MYFSLSEADMLGGGQHSGLQIVKHCLLSTDKHLLQQDVINKAEELFRLKVERVPMPNDERR